jgi:hypothetical protein
MVNALDFFYKYANYEESGINFDKLISLLKRSRLQPTKAVEKSYSEQKTLMMDYFKNPVIAI